MAVVQGGSKEGRIPWVFGIPLVHTMLSPACADSKSAPKGVPTWYLVKPLLRANPSPQLLQQQLPPPMEHWSRGAPRTAPWEASSNPRNCAPHCPASYTYIPALLWTAPVNQPDFSSSGDFTVLISSLSSRSSNFPLEGRKKGRKEGGKEGGREGKKEGRREGGGKERRKEGRREERKKGRREGRREGREKEGLVLSSSLSLSPSLVSTCSVTSLSNVLPRTLLRILVSSVPDPSKI